MAVSVDTAAAHHIGARLHVQGLLAARGLLVDWGRTKTARYIEMTWPTPPTDEQQTAF
ncbi:hypothetical protein [Streptomyces sp. NPDC013489]|uniref:hypothetical protein n=1 Tax=Streptomyces sp. NPDC013489 TaxID=3155606 RepID=UPI0034119486